jgi:hypothetical protein
MPEYPWSDRLNALLRGDGEGQVIRPPAPKRNPKHDYFAPKPEPKRSGSWSADLLGDDVFDMPDKPVPAVQKRTEKMYSSGDLAKLLGRRPVTIRMWITKGYIPEATHHTAGMVGSSAKRRYTHAQAMGLFNICNELGMLENKRVHIGQTFINRVRTLWESVE